MDVIQKIDALVRTGKCTREKRAYVLGALSLWSRRESSAASCFAYRTDAWRNADELAESLEASTLWNVPVCFGAALSALELQNYANAEFLFQQLPERYQLPGIKQICKFHRRFPVGNANFATLASQIWDAFHKKSNAIRHALEEGSYDWAHTLITNIFHAQTSPFPFAISRGDINQLQFSLREARENIFPLLYLVETAPAALLRKWQFRTGVEPVMNENVEIDGVPYPLYKFHYLLDGPVSAGPTRIRVYNSALAKLAAVNSKEAQAVAQQAVDFAVGEIPARAYFHSIVVAKKSLGRIAPTLDQLAYEKGLQLQITARQYLESSSADATHLKPAAGLRSDIVISTSCFPELLQEYRDHKSDVFNHLLSQGVSTGFVFYPVDITDGEPERHLSYVTHQLQYTAGQALLITGTAIGSKFCYVDFVAYDFLSVMSCLQSLFLVAPGGESARFASFYPGAKPTSLDAKKEIAAYRAEMAQFQLG